MQRRPCVALVVVSLECRCQFGAPRQCANQTREYGVACLPGLDHKGQFSCVRFAVNHIVAVERVGLEAVYCMELVNASERPVHTLLKSILV